MTAPPIPQKKTLVRLGLRCTFVTEPSAVLTATTTVCWVLGACSAPNQCSEDCTPPHHCAGTLCWGLGLRGLHPPFLQAGVCSFSALGLGCIFRTEPSAAMTAPHFSCVCSHVGYPVSTLFVGFVLGSEQSAVMTDPPFQLTEPREVNSAPPVAGTNVAHAACSLGAGVRAPPPVIYCLGCFGVLGQPRMIAL